MPLFPNKNISKIINFLKNFLFYSIFTVMHFNLIFYKLMLLLMPGIESSVLIYVSMGYLHLSIFFFSENQLQPSEESDDIENEIHLTETKMSSEPTKTDNPKSSQKENKNPLKIFAKRKTKKSPGKFFISL